MRNTLKLFFMFIFISQISLALSASEIHRFTPLADNERFAYTIDDHSQQIGHVLLFWQKMTMYAVRNNNIGDVAELFTWEPVRSYEIQFRNDFRKAFFIESKSAGRNTGESHHLYIADGFTGEIRRLLPNVGRGSLRVSKDGQFASFFRATFPSEFVHIYLFDVTNETIVGEFVWRPNRPEWVQRRYMISNWRIIRADTVFRIIAVGEAGFIAAVAELNPVTMELTTLWDYFETGLWFESSKDGIRWDDDVSVHNPNVRLQR